MTAYIVPDNPDNPEAAALELIERLPATGSGQGCGIRGRCGAVLLAVR